MMIPAGSRYEQAEQDFASCHVYNQYGYPYLEGTAPNLKIKTVNQNATYLMLPLPTTPIGAPAVNYFVKQDEGMQWLGYKFLGDATRWWEIADINMQIWYPLDMAMGDYIALPVQT
jgi:hypothetical protein